MKILIIEDQTIDILGVYEILWNLGHEVTLAFDGQQGLKEIYKGNFDLVILDWNLPLISGRNVLEKIEKSNFKNHSRLPINIILYSGEDFNSEHFSDYTKLEFLDIWPKPMRAAEILKRLKRIVNDKRRIA